MSPSKFFHRAAAAEATTWGLLLFGMFLKYVTQTTDIGVEIFGMVHGIVFVVYCLATVLVGVDQHWTLKRMLLGLLAAVPPFATLWFDSWIRKSDPITDHWRLSTEDHRSPAQEIVSWAVRNPFAGISAGVLAVVALTGAALFLGPPVG